MGFEDKYGIKEDDTVKKFHLSRTMFAIHNDEVHVADETVDSHATWFEKMGWITEESDELMDEIVRGYSKDKEVYFYRGYDFKCEEQDEKVFFENIDKVVEALKLGDDHEIYGGLIRDTRYTKFPPKKSFGKVGDLDLDIFEK